MTRGVTQTSIEGSLPQISAVTVSLCQNDEARHPNEADVEELIFTMTACEQITWREFQASADETAALTLAWQAVVNALIDEEPQQNGDQSRGYERRALDLTTRALTTAATQIRGGPTLLIDSGPLPFRWAMLPIGAEHFDTVLLSILEQKPAVSSDDLTLCMHEGRPHRKLLKPDKLLAVTANIEAARVHRHLSGVPSVTLSTVVNLAAERKTRAGRLTVVIPTLGEDGLMESIQSIAQQETDGSVEVLIIRSSQRGNTASPMEWRDTAWSELDIFDVCVADKSPYEAMNVGLALADSQWIYFMGCGDTLAHPQVLSALFSEFDCTPEDCGMIYGNVRMRGNGPGAEDGEIYAGEFSYERLREQNICHQGVVYRLSALRQLGGFESRYPVNADWAANLKAWGVLNPKYIDLIFANFVRGGLSTTGWDSAFFEDLDRLWKEHRPCLVEPTTDH